MSRGHADNPLEARLAQSLRAHPFEVVLRFGTTKRRREMLRQEAIRQDELSWLHREKLLRLGDLWSPEPGTRLAREWCEVRQQLAQDGLIEGGGRNA